MLTIKTTNESLRSIAEVPIIKEGVIFGLIFIVPVLGSFIVQEFTPYLKDDLGFTKSMLFLLPIWNLIMWLFEIKLFAFWVPTWVLFAVISIVKLSIM